MRNSIKEPTIREEIIIKIMILIGLLSVMNFLFFFFRPEHRGNNFLFILLSITILYGILRKLYMWYNYANISIPKEPESAPEFSVDILTTYFPGEPYQMIVTTLEAIEKITYPHTTYLCDEANDPFLKKFCEENGVIHVTRDNRKDAKAGNINNALNTVATGDIAVVLDPDHIPEPDFLDRILPHFSDPEIGFVQIVQSYYNIKETLVARGAAEQTFQFYGPMMMTLNAYGTVNAIGANCVFRRAALDSIGGHAPGLCEDMHTAMLLYANKWKAVYVPEVLAKGLAPSNLTTYFKQQLKWTRGTFDLLLKVYPKVFKHLSVRQKIHFGLLPLHYLCGLIYLINFLIPILALTFSTTPWKGNIIDFVLALLPLAGSALLIRTYIQKWVIEKQERGFHIVGGLLQINTWWIYLVGFYYTLINKNVPYLPTPKQSEFNTNLQIVIPNSIVAVISILAIIYGLNQDLTPFSIIMAGFAFFNALIMIFGIYLTVKVTNQNRILRSNLEEETVKKLYSFKQFLRNSFHNAFTFTRITALPLLVLVVFLSLGLKEVKEAERWQNIQAFSYDKPAGEYLGIFHPAKDEGLVDLEEINSIEARKNINFDIISFYLAWNKESITDFPAPLMNNIAAKGAIPLITWEPWASDLDKKDFQENQQILEHISQGHYDSYIRKFADLLGAYDRPIFLRFAHEFDNPQYPWSVSGRNSAKEFKAAWKHVHRIFKEQGATKVVFVWNPWKPEGMAAYYPGDEYVDWIGVTLLNYGPLGEGKDLSFRDLYQPFHDKFYWFTRKPVMLAEFGSVKMEGNQSEWLSNATTSMEDQFPEIEAVILFDSAFDNNIPKNDWYEEKYIDWTTDSIEIVSEVFSDHLKRSEKLLNPLYYRSGIQLDTTNLRGVRYKKGIEWKDNYYVLTKEEIEKDFQKMKSLGLNTIWYQGGSIYDYNVLKYAGENGIKVIYHFDLEPNSGFEDENKLQELEKHILKKIEELKENKAVIAYAFDLDLENFFEKPFLFYQQDLLLDWLQNLSLEIKELDHDTPVLADLALDEGTTSLLKKVKKVVAIDAVGLRVNDSAMLRQAVNFSGSKNVTTFISSISPASYLKATEDVSKNVIFENWQDERLSYRFSLTGLTDFKGRKKAISEKVEAHFNTKEKVFENPLKIEILKPSVPLIAGEVVKYNAMIHSAGNWHYGKEGNEKMEFEWSLIKNDSFGNHLAVKQLGAAPTINLKVPKNYKNYELLLTVKISNGDNVHQLSRKLHTPLE